MSLDFENTRQEDFPDNPIPEGDSPSALQDNITFEKAPEEVPFPQEPPGRTKRMLVEAFQTIVLALIFYFAIDTFIGRVQVQNISMLPTLHEGQFLMVDRFAYRKGDFERGDIVIFHNPNNPDEDYIKRLIGIPGDMIEVENGEIRVNGELQVEPYISGPPQYAGEWTVPEG
ncbi:MAG TPA: signal peptidase I, partial [Anaerolineaceae bacterium]|nr:signal peptidase I [Anaerolineaceae bacterium]